MKTNTLESILKAFRPQKARSTRLERTDKAVLAHARAVLLDRAAEKAYGIKTGRVKGVGHVPRMVGPKWFPGESIVDERRQKGYFSAHYYMDQTAFDKFREAFWKSTGFCVETEKFDFEIAATVLDSLNGKETPVHA